MKRSLRLAGVIGAAAVALVAGAEPASAGNPIQQPADCSTQITVSFNTMYYHMTCTGRPVSEQWQVVVWCSPRGGDGADMFWFGNIVTGEGTSTSSCTFQNRDASDWVYFSNSHLGTGHHQ